MSGLHRLNPKFQPAFDGPALAKGLIHKLRNQFAVPILEAYLFGSAAEGKNTVDSDLDLLIVLPDGYDLKSLYKIVYQPLFSPVATDWILISNSDFHLNKDIGGVSFVATRTGVNISYDTK